MNPKNVDVREEWASDLNKLLERQCEAIAQLRIQLMHLAGDNLPELRLPLEVAANMLNISERTLRRRKQEKRIQFAYEGDKPYVAYAEILRYMRGETATPAERPKRGRPRKPVM